MPKKRIYIVAEIGINHNGDIGICKDLINAAKSAGCDAIKLQKRSIDKVYSADFLNSPRNSPWGITQRDQKEGLEFNLDQYQEIDQYCKSIDIEWFASAWDKDSQMFLRQFDLRLNKVASAMIVNHDLLHSIAEEKKHTFISTGMSNYAQIDSAVKIFKDKRLPFRANAYRIYLSNEG